MKKMTKTDRTKLKKLMISREEDGLAGYQLVTGWSRAKALREYRKTRLNGLTISQYWNEIFKGSDEEIISHLNKNISYYKEDLHYRGCHQQMEQLDHLWRT